MQVTWFIQLDWCDIAILKQLKFFGCIVVFVMITLINGDQHYHLYNRSSIIIQLCAYSGARFI